MATADDFIKSIAFYIQKYAPQYDIIAAGSYLGVAHHKGTGFPVGKVEFIKIDHSRK